jgi:hypothetical protein
MSYVLARLREPSTYAGIASVLAGLSFIPHAADIAGLVVPLGVLISGVIAIVVPQAAA